MEKRVGSHKFLVVSAGECAGVIHTYPYCTRGDVNHIYGNGRRLTPPTLILPFLYLLNDSAFAPLVILSI